MSERASEWVTPAQVMATLDNLAHTYETAHGRSLTCTPFQLPWTGL